MKFRVVSYVPMIVAVMALLIGCPPRLASAQPVRPADSLQSFESAEPSTTTFLDDDGSDQPSTPPKKTPSAPSGKVIDLKTPTGKPVPLPQGNLLQNYLDWLVRIRGKESTVNSVELEGTAEDDRAVLTATVMVQILHNEGWVRVPLYFNEAVIQKSEATFLGDRPDALAKKPDRKKKPGGQSAFSDLTREGGYRWWFRGEGYYRLKLTLIVPVNRTVGLRRLRLSLPPLAAVSNLQLRVSDPRVSATVQKVPASKGPVLVVKAAGKSSSEIRIFGMREQLDLQWKSLPAKTGKQQFMQAETAMLVNLTEETIELRAIQRVQSTGNLSKLTVRLTEGFQPVSVKGNFVKEEFQFDQATRRATVDFTEVRSEPTDILWVLEKKLPTRGGRLSIEGLQVERADKQSIEVAIAKVPGWRIEKQDDKPGAVRRIRLTEYGRRELVEKVPLAGAYRLIRSPYQLAFQATPIQPHVTATPRYRMHFTGKQLLLEGEFHIRVSDEGGAVDEITLQWPSWKSAGWKILPTATSALFRQQIVNEGGNSLIRYRLAGSRRGEFVIPIQAEYPIDTQKRMPLRLPSVIADIVQPSELEVTRAAEVMLDLTDAEELPLTELPGQTKDLTQRYRLDASTLELSARATVHPQKVNATSAIELTPKPFGVTSRQRINITVDYVPLPTIALTVPAELVERFSIYDADGQPVKTFHNIGMNGTAAIEVRLPKPVLGPIELIAVFSAALPDELAPGENASLSIPIVGVSNVKYDSVNIRATDQDTIELSVSGENWRRTRTLEGLLNWTTQSPEAEFTVQLQNPTVPQSLPFSVSRALVRVHVDHAGLARHRAQYRIANEANRIVVTIPNGSTLDNVWWGKKSILETVEQQPVRDGIALRIPALDGDSATTNGGLLTLDYHANYGNQKEWLRTFDFAAPQFPANVWIEQLVWSITLPGNEHLSSFSSSYFGEFRWQRSGIIWQRESVQPFDDVDSWISVGDGPQSGESITGNHYVFRRFGTSETLQIQSVNRSVMVLFGAGLAWLIGVLLVRIPRMRSAFVLLTVVLIAALASLWFSTECQLLVQPAGMGLILAAAFVWIDRRYRPARTPAPLAVANPRDFLLASQEQPSSDRPRPSVIVGSEDPTAVGIEKPEPVSSVPEFRRPG